MGDGKTKPAMRERGGGGGEGRKGIQGVLDFLDENVRVVRSFGSAVSILYKISLALILF